MFSEYRNHNKHRGTIRSYLLVAALVIFPSATMGFTSSSSGIQQKPGAFVRRRPLPTAFKSRTALADSPPDEMVQSVEEVIEALEELQGVDEAIEVLEQQQQLAEDPGSDTILAAAANKSDDAQSVVLQFVEPKGVPSKVKREDIAGDIQTLMEENETDDLVGSIADFILSMVNEKNEDKGEEARTTEEAAVSASLYMNPATAKIASNLVVTWEPAVAEILDRLSRVGNPNRPFMVGVVGIPGSGKSTSCEIVAALMAAQRNGEDHTLIVPMDGYHLPLQTLAEMPNAAEMIYRRGAPDTFDPKGLTRALHEIAYGNETVVSIPGFDHGKGDPVQNQHTFDREKHTVVICEGIYLLHDDDGWESVRSFFDWTLYIDADVDSCIERLKERNKVIPGYTPEEIETRCEIVDRNNALISQGSARRYASQIVTSGAM